MLVTLLLEDGTSERVALTSVIAATEVSQWIQRMGQGERTPEQIVALVRLFEKGDVE